MAYATTSDLIRIGISAAALRNISTADQIMALEAASDLADGYLASRYSLPIVGYQDDLKRAVCCIAAYDLLSTRGFANSGADENVRLRYEDALKWLKEVSQGRINPVGIVDSGGPFVLGQSIIAADVLSDEPRGW